MVDCVVLIASLLMGQAGGSAPAADEVRRLVRRLDAPQLAEREAAEQALVAMGPAILDLLPGAGAELSAEVQQRLGRVREVLQRRQSETVVEPSRVTLRVQSAPVWQVLSEIGRQTGNAMHDGRGPLGEKEAGANVSVDFQGTPFWQAVDQVLDQAGLAVYPYGAERAVVIVGAPPGARRRSTGAAYSGPFRIEVVRIEARRDLRHPAAGSLRLGVEVSWEPRVRPIALKQRLGNLAAVDEQGQALAIGDPAAELEATVRANDTAKELEFSLPLPPREVRQIARLEGRLTAMLPAGEATFRFEHLPQVSNSLKRVAGASVLLEGVRRNGELWEVRLLVRFDRAGAALESHRGWIYQNEAWLEGPDGRVVRPANLATTRRTENEIGLSYSFEAPGPLEGYKFFYRTPVGIMTSGFDYALGPIGLP